jgi:hypothetical protein
MPDGVAGKPTCCLVIWLTAEQRQPPLVHVQAQRLHARHQRPQADAKLAGMHQQGLRDVLLCQVPAQRPAASGGCVGLLAASLSTECMHGQGSVAGGQAGWRGGGAPARPQKNHQAHHTGPGGGGE